MSKDMFQESVSPQTDVTLGANDRLLGTQNGAGTIATLASCFLAAVMPRVLTITRSLTTTK